MSSDSPACHLWSSVDDGWYEVKGNPTTQPSDQHCTPNRVSAPLKEDVRQDSPTGLHCSPSLKLGISSIHSGGWV